MKTSLYLYAVIALIQFSSCTDNDGADRKNQTPPQNINSTDSIRDISGVYINNTILKGSDTMILDSIPRYCVEMHFTSPDSVEIGDGFEDPDKLPYKKEGGKYHIAHASALGDMFFTITPDGTLILEDSAWDHTISNSEFKKVPENKEHKWVFDFYLNDKVIAGTYFICRKGKPTQQKVIFTTDGHVTGLENYLTYELCYAGDCANWTLTAADIIGFKSANDSSTGYAFRKDRKNKRLAMYNIAPPLKDEEGGAILGLAFDLMQE